MDFSFNLNIIENYHSNSQKARLLTEDWIQHNMYCPVCGAPILNKYKANKPVADFYCEKCNSDFELKSKKDINGNLGKRITDGAYSTMIERISSFRNPNFLFLTYNDFKINNLLLIPNHFFIPQIIEKRKPLSKTAQRSGWVGCNINIDKIPNAGKIFVIKNSVQIPPEIVIENYNKTKILMNYHLQKRSWLIDVIKCIDFIEGDSFSLSQMYDFKDVLIRLHPDNHNIEAKIRQQLQYLRDMKIIEFDYKGHYKKLI